MACSMVNFTFYFTSRHVAQVVEASTGNRILQTNILENVLLGRKHSDESEAFVNVNRLRIKSSGMFCVTEVFNLCILPPVL
jgi:hypothetical protein